MDNQAFGVTLCELLGLDPDTVQSIDLHVDYGAVTAVVKHVFKTARGIDAPTVKYEVREVSRITEAG